MKKLIYFTVLLSNLTLFGQISNSSNDIFAEINTNKGTIVIKFFTKESPKTVENFISLANGTNSKVSEIYKNTPFFNGLKFHRVINDFMIQTGDPTGTGTGTPGYAFDDEKNNLKHDSAGIVSMANYGPNTNGSQFFITHKATPWLDGKHTVFGKVVSGLDVVNIIQQDDIINSVIIKNKNENFANTTASNLKKSNSNISYRTDGFYIAEIVPYAYGSYNTTNNPIVAIKIYKNNEAVLLQSIKFTNTLYPSSSYYSTSSSFNTIDYLKSVLLKNTSKYLDFKLIETAGKTKNKNSGYEYDYIHVFKSSMKNYSYNFSMFRNSSYPNSNLQNSSNYNPRSQVNEFKFENDSLILNQYIYKSIKDANYNNVPAYNTLIEKQQQLVFKNIKFIEVKEMSDDYIDKIENEKLNEEKERSRIAEINRQKAEKEWAIQQEKNRLAAIEFEKNRKLKLKSATVGDRICYSQDWTHTESSSGFFGFGSYENKINYKMMIVCYIEKKEGEKFQVRVANIESTNKNEYSTPDYKGVKMREETIHWINPYTDKDWLICE